MAEDRIDLAGLPYGLPGAFDRVAGVDTATGMAKQFPMPQAGEPKDYQTRASLPSAAGLPEGTAAHVNNDPNPDNNGRWAVFGGVWVQSADRVSGLEGRVTSVEGVGRYAVASAELAARGEPNLWPDPDFGGTWTGGGTRSVTNESGRYVWTLSGGSSQKNIPLPDGDRFSVSLELVSKSATNPGSARIWIMQLNGTVEITSARVAITLDSAPSTESELIVRENIPVDPSATALRIFFDSSTIGSISIANMSVVRGALAGIGASGVLVPQIERFPAPNFVGGATTGPDFGAVVMEDGDAVLTISPSGASSSRIYTAPAVGALAPGATLRVQVDIFSDVAGGADLTLLFRNSAGGEVAGRITLENSAVNQWQGIVAIGTVPAGAATIEFRFLRWTSRGATVAKFKRPHVFRDVPKNVVVTEHTIVSAPVSNAKTVYVNGSTGNDAAPGTPGAPMLTGNAAIQALGGNGTVVIQNGTVAPIQVPRDANVKIVADRDASVMILGGILLTEITKTAGYTKVYQAALASAPFASVGRWVYEHGVPEGTIPAGDRHPVHHGRQHRLPMTRIKRVLSIADIEAASDASYFWLDGVIYFSITGGGDASASTIYVPSATGSGITCGAGSTVEIYGIEARYCNAGFNFTGCASYRAQACRAYGNATNGFIRDGAYGTEISCVGGGNGNDGFGTHNTGGMPNGPRSHLLAIDQYAHDNGDDGCSEHERSDATYIGGLNEYNGSTGMAVAVGGQVSVYEMTSRMNARSDGVSEGFGVFGSINPGSDVAFSNTLLCYDCISDRDTHGFKAGTGVLIAKSCKVFDASVSAYTQTGVATLIAMDCGQSGSVAAKTGTVTIKNTAMVT